ncbi:MAG: hypothetical protein ACYSR9_03575 [Planctomycetota bacterium]
MDIETRLHDQLGEVTYHQVCPNDTKKPLHVLTVRIGDYRCRNMGQYLMSEQHRTFLNELKKQYC